MRILVEPSGDFRTHNMGDIAMLAVAVSRLAALWPSAEIEVFSEEPEELRAFCAQAAPVSTTGRQLWLRDDFLPARLKKLTARHPRAAELMHQLPGWIRSTDPALVELLWRLKLRARPAALKDLGAFTQAIMRSDLIVVSGMGGVTDTFPTFTRELLEVLNLAIRRGKPVVMMSQGLGPLTDPVLFERARSILPRVRLIALREDRAGGPLLQSLGVPPQRVVTTGDDAIELAYRARRDDLASGLGVNLRVSDYSGVQWADLEPLKQALQKAAAARRAPLVPVPISNLSDESDAEAIRRLLDGYPDTQPREGWEVATPMAVIDLIKRCRLVVTGSYHAGVFALSCGIPAIGLAKTAYYHDKFNGLAAQFGTGCEVISLSDPQFPVKVRDAIDRLWDLAGELRPGLLKAAAHQVALSHAAYARIRQMVETKAG